MLSLETVYLAKVGSASIKNTCVKMTEYIRSMRTLGQALGSGAEGPVNDTVLPSAEETRPDYVLFALVSIFCVLGLLGIMICNFLKKKGCCCNAKKDPVDTEASTPQREGNNDDLNEDTISVIVHLITEKKENAAALEELLQEYERKQMALSKVSSIKFLMRSPLSSFCSLPRLIPHQSHLHTISGLSGLAPKHGYCCSRCAQKKWPAVLVPPLDSLKDPLKPPQTLISTLQTSTEEKRDPLMSGICVNTQCTQTVVPNMVQESVEGIEAKEWTEGGLKVLSVGRFKVAQIPEYKLVIEETKAPSQEQRKSLFGGILFSSSSLAGLMR